MKITKTQKHPSKVKVRENFEQKTKNNKQNSIDDNPKANNFGHIHRSENTHTDAHK